MKKYIQQAYDKSIYILNNGCEYEFYARFDRKPTKIVLAFDEETLLFCLDNNKKYMDNNDFDELWKLIRRDNKPWGYSELPTKKEQLKILKKFKEKEIVKKPLRNETRTERLNLLITPSLEKSVKNKCKKLDISLNECVNQLLTKWVE